MATAPASDNGTALARFVKFITAIDRYIARLVIMPMLAVFVIAASLLVLDKMLTLFDFVATQGGPVTVVFKMLANMLPEYASLAIPLGLMLGILFAFRGLAMSSELDVMRAPKSPCSVRWGWRSGQRSLPTGGHRRGSIRHAARCGPAAC